MMWWRWLKLAKGNAERKAIASQTVIDVRKRVAEMLANRANRVAMGIVVPTEIVAPKVVAQMVSRLAMAIVLPKAKADVARCLGSLSCSIAITMASSAKMNSIGSRKSSPNWIGTRTDS